MKQQWMMYTKRADFHEIGARFHIAPIIARIMVNREIADEDMGKFLNGMIKDLYPPHLLKGMEKAVDLLLAAGRNGQRVRIVGDYDIDGICSTYILYRGFLALGIRADFEIPDRIKDGYGINESIIAKAKEDGIEVIVTCDNGIAAFEALELAKKHKICLILTDHHEVFQDEDGHDLLPPADTIINPKQADCSYPFKSICGAMVAFKLIAGIFSRLIFGRGSLENIFAPLDYSEDQGFPTGFDYIEGKELRMLLGDLTQFAAIATIGDLMPLRDENRIMVRYGLKRIQKTKNLGLAALMDVCGIRRKEINSYHIGFIIGPCLNASGRLSTAKLALRMLLAEDIQEAEGLALELKELNDERKEKTIAGTARAVELVEQGMQKDSVLTVYLADTHESIAGIIAGRLKEKFQKPSIVLTDTEDGLIKGSARSIQQYHMFNKLCEVKELFTKFGGHPMAAGMSLKRENLPKLHDLLNAYSGLTEEDFKETTWIDSLLPFRCLNEELVQELSCLEPHGMGNEKPVFAVRNAEILQCRILGKNRNAIKLNLKDEEGVQIEGMYFADGDAFLEELGEHRFIHILYYPTLNVFNGRRTIEITLKRWKLGER